MDIEHLNKSQIVLLTLLVSFITSIATGIVTVSLMEQAPPVIPQTINRIVERTVERVVPHETQTATVITTEKTVVVKETELISQAVSRIRPSVLKVHAKATDGKAADFLARGFVIADAYAITSFPGAKLDAEYVVVVGDKLIPAKVVKLHATSSIAVLSLTEEKDAHTPAATVNDGAVTLGQTIVAVTGIQSLKVASGIVTASDEREGGAQASFETNLADEALVTGGAVLNTDGAVIGVYTGDPQIVPASDIKAIMASIPKPADPPPEAKDAKNAAKSTQ